MGREGITEKVTVELRPKGGQRVMPTWTTKIPVNLECKCPEGEFGHCAGETTK